MSWFVVDVETDGPIPGDYSMVAVGAIKVDPSLGATFKGELRPISDQYQQENLDVAGYTRDETLDHEEPATVMRSFRDWVQKQNSSHRPQFIADNSGFDWMFVCWYFHHFLDENPFGHSSQDLGSLYKGTVKSVFENFKHLRDTEHTHDPVDDALGNAEALLKLKRDHDLEIAW